MDMNPRDDQKIIHDMAKDLTDHLEAEIVWKKCPHCGTNVPIGMKEKKDDISQGS